jgi:biopolymer transport protein ExbD
MITRPLDLASRLRPPPRNHDFLFMVNGGLIVMFFMLFGSRFVLSPGLGVDFIMPEMPGALAGASRTTHVISVVRPGLIFVDDGAINFDQLREWLKVQASQTEQPSLLVRTNASKVPVNDLIDITSAAHAAGFVRVVIGALEPARSGSDATKP